MKKIKLLKLLIILLFVGFFLIGCFKKSSYIYLEEQVNEFLDEFYQTINDEKRKFVAVDFRCKDDYEEEHIRQFQNYDWQNGSLEELTTWLKSNYAKKYEVYIFSEKGVDSNLLEFLQDYYHKVYIYIGSYEILREYASTTFVLESGPYNCAC